MVESWRVIHVHNKVNIKVAIILEKLAITTEGNHWEIKNYAVLTATMVDKFP